MKIRFYKLLATSFLYFAFTLSCCFAENIKVGIDPEKLYTTAKVQSFGGIWNLEFIKNVATGTISVSDTVKVGEDAVIMLVSKGLVGRIISERELDLGYDKVIISGGELISMELPEASPRVFKGKIEITHNKEFLNIVNELSIKDYVQACTSIGCISCEPEAVKAHIAVVESKALYLKQKTQHPNDNYDVCNTPHCIPYKGNGANRELVELLYDKTLKKLICYQDKIIFPRYHVTCSGKISSAKDVYGVDDEPYHIAHFDVKDNKGSENCFHSPSFHWTIEIPANSIEDFLSLEFAGGAENVYTKWDPIKVDAVGRILMIQILGRKTKQVSGIEFFNHLHEHYGENSMKSMRFTFEPLKRTILVRGMGEGDGVGLCLYGADGLARKGDTYEQILEFYYPGTVLK